MEYIEEYKRREIYTTGSLNTKNILWYNIVNILTGGWEYGANNNNKKFK